MKEETKTQITITPAIGWLTIFTVLALAFLFKVWNERQQTYETRAFRLAAEHQAVAADRIADALERRWPPEARVGEDGHFEKVMADAWPEATLPTLGGNAHEKLKDAVAEPAAQPKKRRLNLPGYNH